MSTLVQTLNSKAEITVPAGQIHGDLTIPDHAIGAVIFAHGSGSSRFSPRNQFVARQLNQLRLGTLLIDLLTADEERVDTVTAGYRFDISLLADRLVAATEWLMTNRSTQELPLGYFGASTGAAAALMAAANASAVEAIVSRGGRPDLAGTALHEVRAATLLIVGELDTAVIQMNRAALEQLSQCRQKSLVIVHGATHLFAETGALEEVATLAGDWFQRFLVKRDGK
jgi:dienelactone hydrolase